MRRRLALVSLAVSSLVVPAFIIPLATLVSNQAETRPLRLAEGRAQGVAQAIVAVVGALGREAGLTEEIAERVFRALPEPEGMSIVLPNGTVEGAPVEIGSSIEVARRERTAFSAAVEGGVEVLVPIVALSPPGEPDPVVRAFVGDAELTEGVVTAWLMLGALGIFLILVTVFAADRLGRSIVRPVMTLAHAARSLGDGDLDVRVEPAGPEEIANVGEAFNFLATRLEALLEAERESVADLSHRLRTPLTALRLQAETLHDAEDRASLVADIDRVERAVDRRIADARRPTSGAEEPNADLAAVVRHRAAFWKVLADEQDRPAAVSTTQAALLVDVAAEELGALVDALLANVFSYTPAGTPYSISARRGPDDTVVLVVEDEGPGLPDTEVVERGTSGGGSTGLGLSIALRTAQRTGGALEAKSRPDGGTRIEVVFGPAKRRPLTGAPARWLRGAGNAEPGPEGPGSRR